MTRLQLLLCKLAEEASEVAQISLKTQQYGLDEVRKGQAQTNAQRAHAELDDLSAIVEMINDEFGFGYIPNRDRIEAKKVRVNRYAEYAVTLGTVDQEVQHVSTEVGTPEVPAKKPRDRNRHWDMQRYRNPFELNRRSDFAEKVTRDFIAAASKIAEKWRREGRISLTQTQKKQGE